MRKVSEILRLYFGAGLSLRQVARSCNIGRSTAGDYVQRALKAGLGWPLPAGMDEAGLQAALFKRPNHNTKRPVLDIPYLHAEMARKGVTLQLLWHKYKEVHADGYQYTQFCEHYRRGRKKLDLCLRREHRAGEKTFVDWAGQTVPIIDRDTGAITLASIFVAVLGASNYTYAEAFASQALSHWITAHVHAFEFFGGTTEIIIPDNPKTGVNKPCPYEPDLNPLYHNMATHYGTAIIPARVRKPQDKAKVEAGVLLVERWILAALRNHTFFSLAELNAAVPAGNQPHAQLCPRSGHHPARAPAQGAPGVPGLDPIPHHPPGGEGRPAHGTISADHYDL